MAGNNEEFDPFAEEKVAVFKREAENSLLAFSPIGKPSCISEIDDIFMGKKLADGFHDGEPAKA